MKHCGVCKKEMVDDGWATCHECLVTMSKAIDLMGALSEATKRGDDSGEETEGEAK